MVGRRDIINKAERGKRWEKPRSGGGVAVARREGRWD